MTIRDIVNFVMEKKKPGMFSAYPTEIEVALEVDRAMKDGTIFYITDDQNKLVGMILAEKNDEKKEIFVTENLAMSIENLRRFAVKANTTWPEYSLKWMKHGIVKQHDTSKVYSKLAI